MLSPLPQVCYKADPERQVTILLSGLVAAAAEAAFVRRSRSFFGQARDELAAVPQSAGYPDGSLYQFVTGVPRKSLPEDLKKCDVPTLIIHGDDDQIVPIGASAHAASKLVIAEEGGHLIGNS